MTAHDGDATTAAHEAVGVSERTLMKGLHGVRYLVKDIPRAVAFYTQHLNFTVLHVHLQFALLSISGGHLLLSGPGASGSRPMPNGQTQAPGGWNRIVLEVADLPRLVADLKDAGLRFRNNVETGPVGRQIQIEDPDGNPIEFFERTV